MIFQLHLLWKSNKFAATFQFFSNINFLISMLPKDIVLKACIFDLDGVIVDTAKYHYIAWRRLANELGFDFDETFNERLKGVSRMDSLNLILDEGGITLQENEKVEWASKKNDWYREFILQMKEDEALDGVIPFLRELQQDRIKIGLGSASKNAVPILERLKIKHFFEVIIDGTKTTKGKPDPQVFQLGAQGLGVLPSECVVFEDAAKGIDAALAGGFWAVGVGDVRHLPHAHVVIPGFADLTWKQLKSQEI